MTATNRPKHSKADQIKAEKANTMRDIGLRFGTVVISTSGVLICDIARLALSI